MQLQDLCSCTWLLKAGHLFDRSPTTLSCVVGSCWWRTCWIFKFVWLLCFWPNICVMTLSSDWRCSMIKSEWLQAACVIRCFRDYGVDITLVSQFHCLPILSTYQWSLLWVTVLCSVISCATYLYLSKSRNSRASRKRHLILQSLSMMPKATLRGKRYESLHVLDCGVKLRICGTQYFLLSTVAELKQDLKLPYATCEKQMK